LPLHTELSNADIERVCQVVRSASRTPFSARIAAPAHVLALGVGPMLPAFELLGSYA
jgi:hypothetical protein